MSDIQTFKVALAQEYGIDLAILIQFFVNVISVHKRAGRHNHDGHTWNYCTRNDLRAHFPYWTAIDIKNRLKKLINMGVLKRGNYNKRSNDNTAWFAFVDEERWGISSISYLGQNCPTPDKIVQALPQSNHRSSKKDNVRETLSSRQPREKTMAPAKRWRLDNDQSWTLLWLQERIAGTDEGTLAYWAKTYSLERLKEVYEWAVQNGANSVGAYMNRILKKGSSVENDNSRINKKSAQDFKNETHWNALNLMERYAKVELASGSTEEIPYNLDPMAFFTKLVNLKEIS